MVIIFQQHPSRQPDTPPTVIHFSSRPLPLIALALALPALAPIARALVELPSGRITLQTTATETYDSYMIGTANHDADYLTSFLPQLTYNHLVGPSDLTVFGGISFNRYASETEFNSNDVRAGLKSNFPMAEGSRLTGDLAAAYTEDTVIDPVLNDRVPSKNYTADLNASYRLGLKMTLADSVNYTRSERRFYGTQTIWSNNARFTYADFLEDTNLHFGHTYTRTNSADSNYALWAANAGQIGSIPDSKLDQTANTFSTGVSHPLYGSIIGEVDYGYTLLHRQASETAGGSTTERGNTVSLSITGPFLPPSRFPKVKSSASIAYNQSQSPGINDNGQKTVVGQANLSWTARERTDISLNASRSTSLGSSNFTIVKSLVGMSVTENIGLATTAVVNTSYSWMTVRGLNRNDTILQAGLSLNHKLNQYWNLGARYSFEKDNTDAKKTEFVATRYQLEDYTRHVVSAYVSFSY